MLAVFDKLDSFDYSIDVGHHHKCMTQALTVIQSDKA